jgi:hypothetical protein
MADKDLKAALYGALGMEVPTRGTKAGSVRETTEKFGALIVKAIKPTKKGNVMVHVLKPEDFNGKVNNSKGEPAQCGIATLERFASEWANKNKGYSVEKIRQDKKVIAVAVVKLA